MRGKSALVAYVVAATAAAGCGGSSSSKSKEDTEKVLKDWITSAVEQDGAKYCKALSKDLIEKVTGAQSDKAKTKCEQLVEKGDPKLPLRMTIKPGKAAKNTAQARLVVSAPKGPILLRKEDGDFKIDQAEPSAAALEQPFKSKKKRSKRQ